MALVINAFDEIGFFGLTAEHVLEQIDKARDIGEFDVIDFRISSNGGSVREALAIADVLTQSGAEVKTTVVGFAFSAAAILSQVGSTRSMVENGLLMFHDPSLLTEGNSDDLLKAAGMLEKMTDGMVAMIAARSGLSVAVVAKMSENETFLTAQEALDLNLIDEIVLAAGVEAAATLAAEVLAAIPERYQSIAANFKETKITAGSVPAKTPTPVNRRKTMDTPTPATLGELKAKFPKSTADWRETQIEAEATLQDAAIAYATHVEERAEAAAAELAETHRKALEEATAKVPATPAVAPGHEPLTAAGVSTEGVAQTGDPVADFDLAVLAATKDRSLTRRQAIRYLTLTNREAFQAYIEATNKTDPLQERLVRDKFDGLAKIK